MEYMMNKTDLMTWEFVRPKIRAYLIQREWNTKLLKTLCYTDYLDLAVVFEVILGENQEGILSFPVTKNVLEKWNVQIEDVYEAEMENLKRENVMVWGISGFHVLQCSRGRNGACVMLRKEILKVYAEITETDGIFILPSSLHELILVEDDGKQTAERLKQMVYEINRMPDVILPEERLSDSVYLYRRETDEVVIAA